jgi:hypothetical protein
MRIIQEKNDLNKKLSIKNIIASDFELPLRLANDTSILDKYLAHIDDDDDPIDPHQPSLFDGFSFIECSSYPHVCIYLLKNDHQTCVNGSDCSHLHCR